MTDTCHDPITDPNTTWYGPHECAVCGTIIVKAAREQGGAEFEPPDRLMKIWHRGSESAIPETVYPMVWRLHVHMADTRQQPQAVLPPEEQL